MVISSFKGSSGSIYVVTTEGKALQLLDGSWSELVDESIHRDLRIKRLSCCRTALWAICGDHQVYLRVESDVPIRVKEESYENQRWNPVDGFCNKLLPTDRTFYSSQDGLTDRDLKSVILPSQAWVWDDQWHLELLHEGQHLEAEVLYLYYHMNLKVAFSKFFSWKGLDICNWFSKSLFISKGMEFLCKTKEMGAESAL